ncbi:hypothetical protein ACHAXT_004061 [Thalassiosira profunda]
MATATTVAAHRIAGRRPLLSAACRSLSSLSSARKTPASLTASALRRSILPSPSSPTLMATMAARTIYPRPLSSVGFARCFASASSIQPEIKLYQYHICPFCNIAKSVLSYANLDYQAVEVNPLTKAELKPWSGDYKKVPIAMIDGSQVNGSDEIVESILGSSDVQKALEEQWAGEMGDSEDKMTMQQFQKSENAQKWTEFARDDLAALLYPNICGSLGDSFDAFAYIKGVDSLSALQKVSIQSLGALAMYFAASKVKSKRGITDERAALHEALDKFESEGLENGKLPYSSGLQCPDRAIWRFSAFSTL